MRLRTLSILFLPFLLSSCARERYYLISGYAQGGTYEIKCSEADIPPHRLKDGIDSVLTSIDSAVNGYNPESLLSRHNRGQSIEDDGGTAFRILEDLVRKGDSLFTATHGVIDTRAGALYDVWGFGFKEDRLPSEEMVREAKKDRSKLNFNAIAQGYSADKIAGYLLRHDVHNFLVNIGGEMYCKGVNPSGKGWTIGIDAPVDGNMEPGRQLSATFRLGDDADCGVVTSGNYRKFYIVDGVKYSHSIDPRTASPVDNNMLSATVIAGSSTIADALATFCMVAGFEQAKEFILADGSVEACLITSDTTWCSPGFILDR